MAATSNGCATRFAPMAIINRHVEMLRVVTSAAGVNLRADVTGSERALIELRKRALIE